MILQGNCLEVLKTLEPNSVDAVVTDPPYGLSFMGKKWDYDVPSVDVWREVFRVLKPGGHLLSFAGTRTQHRMAVNIEDAGFEIRDMIAWVYGSGFPKSLNVQQAINKAARGCPQGTADPLSPNHGKFKGGCSEENPQGRGFGAGAGSFMDEQGKGRGDDEGEWKGWGTALKPSHEDITVAQKPFDNDRYFDIMVREIITHVCQLPSAAPTAKQLFQLSQQEQGEVVGIVQWLAEKNTNTQAALHALMDTLLSGEKTGNTTSNIVSSWLNTLDALSQQWNMFTTETKTSLITDLKTLNYLLSQTTQSTTTKDETRASGEGASVELVASLFNALKLKLQITHTLSANESAISRVGNEGIRPNLEPITVARKPLGTPAVDVVKAVEYVMMENGLTNITWRKDYPAQKKNTNKETEDAGLVKEKTTHSIVTDTDSEYDNALENGINRTTGNNENTDNSTTENSDNPSLMSTEGSALAVEKQSQPFSPSTTSTVAEPSTEKPLTEKSTLNSDDKGFLLDTACFAGTATGALGLGSVLIKQNDDGSYTWPSELPKFIPAQSMTVAENVLTHGTGGLNIDGCRVGTDEITTQGGDKFPSLYGTFKTAEQTTHTGRFPANLIHDGSEEVVGLFPKTKSGKLKSNQYVKPSGNNDSMFAGDGAFEHKGYEADSGSASRFFYCAKSSKSDRNSGLGSILTVKYNSGICKEENTVVVQLLQKVISEQAPASFNIGESGESITVLCHQDSLSITKTTISKIIESRILNSLMLSLTNEYTVGANSEMESGGSHAESVASLRKWILDTTNGEMELARGASDVALKTLQATSEEDAWKPMTNIHSTVKPTDLMRYLCRLVTPKGGTVLDPFMGSGSTGKAAKLESFNFIGIELDPTYFQIAKARIG